MGLTKKDITDKAEELRVEMGLPNFAFSDGWFSNFKRRQSITHRAIGEI